MVRRLAGRALLLSLLLAAMMVNHAAQELPETVASHFGADGAADGWMSRAAFLRFVVLLIAGMSALLAGLAWMLPWLPDSTISLPERDFWLAPDRRAETIRKLRDMLFGMGAATNLFFVLLVHQTVAANRLPEPRLSGGFWWLMAVCFSFIMGWAIWWLRRWRRPAGA